jgi:6-pyruvoyl-tetrahydropterin synthase
MVTWTHQFLLSSVHRHHNPDLTEEENARLFHKCSRIHGHEYKVEVTFGVNSEQEQDALTRLRTARELESKLFEVMRGEYLNDFMGNTSGEIIAQRLFGKARECVGSIVLRVTVRETRKNSFFFAAGE